MCAGGQALILWFKINSILQLIKFIYWASIYLLKVTDGNTRWKCEICLKLIIKTPDYCHWRHSGVLTVNFKHISYLALVFLVFLLLNLNRENPSWIVKVTLPKTHHVALLLFVKNVWFTVVRGELRTCDTRKMDLFAKIVHSLKSLIILTRSSILGSITRCWIYLGYFFRFTFSIDLLISPNIFKNQLSVNSAHKCLFKVYTRTIALGVEPVQIWKRCYHIKVCNIVLRFSVILSRSLHYLLVLLLLTLSILCLL